MKRMAHLALGLLLALSLAGCRQPQVPPSPTPTPPQTPTSGGFPLTLTDALGQPVTLNGPPQRIISLAPSLTEILFALDLGDRVVGVTTFCKYPPEALQKEKVGGYVNPNHEKIVGLAPDVVFATRGTPRSLMEGLRKAGIATFALDQTTFEDVLGSIEQIGLACGVEKRGHELADRLRHVRLEIADKTKALREGQRPRALLVLSLQPLFVAGPGNFQDEMLRDCGARNVSGLQKPFAALSEEAVVQADPQVVVFPSNDSGQTVTKESQLRRLRASAAWRNVTAVRDGRIIVIDVEHLSVPGPRLELGFRELAAQLHPELFAP